MTNAEAVEVVLNRSGWKNMDLQLELTIASLWRISPRAFLGRFVHFFFVQKIVVRWKKN